MNVSFGAKIPQSRIQLARDINNTELPVGEYLKERLPEIKPALEKVAELYKANVTLAQKGDLLMVNSGPITSYVDMANMKKGSELYDGIVNNIKANSEAGKGLDNAKTFLA